MEFPEYRYQEFPKMMLDRDGKPLLNEFGREIIVNSIHEELKVASERTVAPTTEKIKSDVESLKRELSAKEAQIVALEGAKEPAKSGKAA